MIELREAEHLQTDLRSVAYSAIMQLIELQGLNNEHANFRRMEIINEAEKKMNKLIKLYKGGKRG